MPDTNVISGIAREVGSWGLYNDFLSNKECYLSSYCETELQNYERRHPEIPEVHSRIRRLTRVWKTMKIPADFDERVAELQAEFPVANRRDRRDRQNLALVIDTDVIFVTGDRKLAEICEILAEQGRLKFWSHHTHGPKRKKRKRGRTGRTRRSA